MLLPPDFKSCSHSNLELSPCLFNFGAIGQKLVDPVLFQTQLIFYHVTNFETIIDYRLALSHFNLDTEGWDPPPYTYSES